MVCLKMLKKCFLWRDIKISLLYNVKTLEAQQLGKILKVSGVIFRIFQLLSLKCETKAIGSTNRELRLCDYSCQTSNGERCKKKKTIISLLDPEKYLSWRQLTVIWELIPNNLSKHYIINLWYVFASCPIAIQVVVTLM